MYCNLLQFAVGSCWRAGHQGIPGYERAGPFDLNVALLCLQQYGAANAAPIRPDEAKRRRLSNVSIPKGPNHESNQLVPHDRQRA